MPCSIPYGICSTLVLPLEREQLVGLYAAAPETALDVRPAVEAALDEPLEYPPLAQAVVPGDQVAIVVDRYLPQGAEIAACIVERLAACGIGPDAMTVLYCDPVAAQSAPKSAAKTETHHPEDRTRLSFLGSTPSGKPLYINRAIGEADFVIPIGLARGPASWSYHGPLGAVYPQCSDAEAHKRYRNPGLLHSESETATRAQVEVDGVGRQTGAQFTVQLVPGAGDGIAAVVAGELNAVRRRVDSLFAARYRHEPKSPAQVVVAALTGATFQTWEQAALALEASLAAVAEGGAIALCTDLAEPPGPALELLGKAGDDREDLEPHLRKERPIDFFPALILLAAQRRARVYLLSKLDAATVEDLGLSPIADPADIGRLASRRGSCLVLGNAQHARITAASE